MRLLPTPLLLAALLSLSQCKHKSPDPAPPPTNPLAALPPETQTGAGTFGCLVNGKAYVTVSPIKCRGDWQGIKTLFISADSNEDGQYSGDYFGVGLLINSAQILQSNQTFTLVIFKQPISPINNQFVADAVSGSKPCVYQGNFIKTGQVELVKFDGVGRIAAGRFAFTLYEPGGCDTLRVTNGRFDVKF